MCKQVTFLFRPSKSSVAFVQFNGLDIQFPWLFERVELLRLSIACRRFGGGDKRIFDCRLTGDYFLVTFELLTPVKSL